MIVWVYSEICEDPILKEGKKDIIKILKCFGLSIVVKTNVKSANYVDGNFDQTTDISKLYRKSHDEPVYTNKYSNQQSFISQME